MSPAKFSVIALLALCLSPLAHAKATRSIASWAQAEKLKLPDPGWSLSQLAAWAPKADYLGQDFLRKPGQGDIMTRFGTLVSGSCFEGATKKQAKERLHKIEKMIGYSIAQTHRCRAKLGLAATWDAIMRMRRIRLSCVEQLAWDFEAQMLEKGSLDAAGTTHQFEVHTTAKYLDAAALVDASALFFHEALHFGPNNNRRWHHEPNKEHYSGGCVSSKFLDQVYLVQAACFPLSASGKAFYDRDDGAASCPRKAGDSDVCLSAFTEVESDAIGWAEKHFFGSGRLARKAPVEQARISCAKIKNIHQIHWKLEAERELLNTKLKTAKQLLERDLAQRAPDSVNRIELFLVNTRDEINSIYAARTSSRQVSDRLRDLSRYRAIVAKTIQDTCAVGLRELRGFCSIKTPPPLPTLDLAIEHAKTINSSDYTLFTPPVEID